VDAREQLKVRGDLVLRRRGDKPLSVESPLIATAEADDILVNRRRRGESACT
jgi:hypothetical protein